MLTTALVNVFGGYQQKSKWSTESRAHQRTCFFSLTLQCNTPCRLIGSVCGSVSPVDRSLSVDFTWTDTTAALCARWLVCILSICVCNRKVSFTLFFLQKRMCSILSGSAKENEDLLESLEVDIALSLFFGKWIFNLVVATEAALNECLICARKWHYQVEASFNLALAFSRVWMCPHSVSMSSVSV